MKKEKLESIIKNYVAGDNRGIAHVGGTFKIPKNEYETCDKMYKWDIELMDELMEKATKQIPELGHHVVRCVICEKNLGHWSPIHQKPKIAMLIICPDCRENKSIWKDYKKGILKY